MKVFYTEDQKFEVRPWGGRMCFLATEESAQSKQEKCVIGALRVYQFQLN